MLLQNKRAIVVGGASGIGAATARAFAREGARVAVLDIADDKGQSVASALGESAMFARCDVMSRSSVFSAFDIAATWLGGLDVLAHLAGINQRVAAEAITDDDWQRMMDNHARGTMLSNQAAFGYLKDHGGRIINTGSGAAIQGQPAMGVEDVLGEAHYAAAKGAIMAWTRGIAREWARHGITANSLIPAGWTPMYQQGRDQMSREAVAAHDAFLETAIPLRGRLGDPDEDVAPAVVFLASDLSRFVTGQALAVNGGLLMIG